MELKKKIELFNIKEVYFDILKRSNNYEDINLEIKNLIRYYYEKNKSTIKEKDITILKEINSCFVKPLTFDNFIKCLEKKGLPLKKTGKVLRNITVNFHSKLPIDSIIKFFGVQKVNDMILPIINND